MYPALIPGDYIVANKLIPGPRLNNLFALIFGGCKRLKGYRGIERGEVVVFKMIPARSISKAAQDADAHMVKRCVGLPGDTLSIVNGFYKVNKLPSIGNYGNQSKLSVLNMDEIKTNGALYECFPWDTLHNWTIQNFGPVYIPKKGGRIRLSRSNISVYKDAIEFDSRGKIMIEDQLVYLNGRRILDYTFLGNFYFMAGDNVSHSNDSRYWGFIPEDLIVGKATFVLTSRDLHSNEYEYSRWFKLIR